MSERLQRARRKAGLTQLELARAVEISETQVSKLETGRAQASPEIKTRIAAILQCPTFELFTA